MRYTYDFEADALYVYLGDGVPHRQVQIHDVTVDVDQGGRVLGVEVIGTRLGWDPEPVIREHDLSVDQAGFLRQLAAWHPVVIGRPSAPASAVGHAAKLELTIPA